MSNYIDTRDLIKERNETKSIILDAFNDEFTTDYTDYDEIDFELVDDNKEFKETTKLTRVVRIKGTKNFRPLFRNEIGAYYLKNKKEVYLKQ